MAIISVFNARIIYNKPLQEKKSLSECNYFQMRLALSGHIRQIIPGQFINIKLTNSYNPLLRRPFTIFDTARKSGRPARPSLPTSGRRSGGYDTIDIVYQVVGKGTRLMSSMKRGDKINVMGPLGNGFKINKNANISIIVAGGIGIAGLYLLLKELISLKHTKVYLFIGTKTKSDLCLLPILRHLISNIIISTEDGSSGAKGLITTALEKFLHKFIIHNSQFIISLYACGPSGMSEAIRQLAVDNNIPAQISLEERMGCGIGLCRVCVCPVRSEHGKDSNRFSGSNISALDASNGVCRAIPKKPFYAVPKLRSGKGQPPTKEWEYSTVCEDGPVFDAAQLYPMAP